MTLPGKQSWRLQKPLEVRPPAANTLLPLFGPCLPEVTGLSRTQLPGLALARVSSYGGNR